MPGRQVPLITGQIYHVFNRGIDRRTTFTNKREYRRALAVINYYQFSFPPVRFSRFLALSISDRDAILRKIKANNKKMIEIYALCLMPNHFHLLIRQKIDKGISLFMSQLLNSYTRYFNTAHKRVGSLFLDQFKAVRIETDEQLVHVSRYIHLNPYTSYVVEDIESIFSYPWSSLSEYLNERIEGLCQQREILTFFGGKRNAYRKFLLDQAEYQRELGMIKHLMMDD